MSVIDKFQSNDVCENGEGHKRNGNVGVLQNVDFGASTTGRSASKKRATETPLNKRLVERKNRTDNRKWHKIVNHAFVLATHRYKQNDGLRIHKNALPPAEVTRRKADDLRVDERADDSRHHSPKKQLQNIFMNESVKFCSGAGVNKHCYQNTNKNNIGEQSEKCDDRRGVGLNERYHFIIYCGRGQLVFWAKSVSSNSPTTVVVEFANCHVG